jgi:pimeloyl-ACP methyl ester carboxylesterase
MQLFYRQLGSGEPIIIVHGLYGSSDNWLNIAKKLSEKHSIYAIDLRNHGQSPHSKNFSISVMAEDLYQFVKEHNLKKINLIGHSLGGKISLEFAAKHTEYIKNLIIVDIAPRKYTDDEFEERKKHKEIINILKNINLQKYKNRKDAVEELNKIDTSGRLKLFMMKNIKRQKDGTLQWRINLESIADNLSNILNNFEADISKIDCPTLFIKAEKSNYLTKKDFQLITSKMQKPEITIIEDTSHWLHSEKPDIFTKIVLNFLERNQ